jgi:hypothetical protein
VPRHPMNIYYNVATKAEEVDEYNWIYNSRAAGGAGICEGSSTSTCIAPLSTSTGFDSYIVPMETRIAFDDVVSADSDPLYAHQSNLTEDRILYPVLDGVLAKYAATFTTATPVVNLRYTDVMTLQHRQEAWRAAVSSRQIEAYVQDGRVTVVNHGSAAVDVPLTAPTGTTNVKVVMGLEINNGVYGEAYGGQSSTWKSMPRNGQQLLRLPS